MAAKEYTIASYHHDRRTEYTGTISYLIDDVFGYTLECGHSWNSKISRRPKTAKALVNALNQSVEEMQGGCYDRDFYELVD